MKKIIVVEKSHTYRGSVERVVIPSGVTCNFCGESKYPCFRSPVSFQNYHEVDICEDCVKQLAEFIKQNNK